METVRPILVMLIALGVLAGLGTMTAFAQEPDGTSPALSAYIDNESHSIEGITTHYFRFEYAGDNSPINISLLNGADRNLAFNVYTPEQINESTWWLLPPIGRGTPLHQTDLVWLGKFYVPGTYYVGLQNFGDQLQEYTMTISGPSVRLCPVSTDPCPPMKLIPNP